MAQDWFDKLRSIMEYVESQERSAARYLAEGDLEHHKEYLQSAQNYREMAEKLMAKFRIDQADLLARDELTETPFNKAFVLLGDDRNTTFDGWCYTLFQQIAEHCECKTYGLYKWDPESRRTRLQVTIVGYTNDVQYAELLWTSAYLAFTAHVDPRPNPELSERENIYRMRKSGMPRKDVAALLWGQWTHSNSAKVGRIFKEEAARRGEDASAMTRGFDHEVYREAYAREFVWTVTDRLREARDAALSSGGAVSLHGRAEKVLEAFYTVFPELRPKPPSEVVVEDEETNNGKKRVAKRKGPTAAQMKREHRRYYSPSARAGAGAGVEAGRKVDINRVTTGGQSGRLGEFKEVKEIG